MSCVSPENFELNLNEMKSLGIPFGFKLNAFIETNPQPNFAAVYKKNKTGNPNEFLGVRKDLTPNKMTEFAKIQRCWSYNIGWLLRNKPCSYKRDV